MGKWEYWAKYSTSCLWSLIPNSNLTTSSLARCVRNGLTRRLVPYPVWPIRSSAHTAKDMQSSSSDAYSYIHTPHLITHQPNKYRWAWPLHTAMHMFLVQLSEPPCRASYLACPTFWYCCDLKFWPFLVDVNRPVCICYYTVVSTCIIYKKNHYTEELKSLVD